MVQRLFLQAVAVVLGVSSLAAQERTAPARDAALGAWNIRVCKRAPCDGADSTAFVASGVLMLAPSTAFLEPIPNSLARVLQRWRSGFGPPNACWIARALQPNQQSFASIAATGGLSWTRTDSVVSFFLYRSPDALHSASVVIRGDSLFGVGRSSGAGVMDVAWPPDTIVGWRRGAVDPAECIAAVAADTL